MLAQLLKDVPVKRHAFSIAIPTYNRRKFLERRIFELLPQLPSDAVIHIYDNGSTDGTVESVTAINDCRIVLHRWDNNRGISRNITRAIEETDSDWFWLLSDDDPVAEGAIETIQRIINSTEAGIIAFKTQGNSITNEAIYSSPSEYVKNQNIMNLSYISALVINRSIVVAGGRLLAPASYSLLPHIPMIMAALELGIKVQTSCKPVVTPQKGEHRVSRKEILLGISTLPSFFKDPLRAVIAKQIRGATRWMCFSALAQSSSDAEIDEWRRIVRIANKTLSLQGANGLHTIFTSKWVSNQDRKRELLLMIALILPTHILKKLAFKLSNSTHQNSEITHYDSKI